MAHNSVYPAQRPLRRSFQNRKPLAGEIALSFGCVRPTPRPFQVSPSREPSRESRRPNQCRATAADPPARREATYCPKGAFPPGARRHLWTPSRKPHSNAEPKTNNPREFRTGLGLCPGTIVSLAWGFASVTRRSSVAAAWHELPAATLPPGSSQEYGRHWPSL